MPNHLGDSNLHTGSIPSDANIIWKHSHRHTQKQCLIWAPHGLLQQTHRINTRVINPKVCLLALLRGFLDNCSVKKTYSFLHPFAKWTIWGRWWLWFWGIIQGLVSGNVLLAGYMQSRLNSKIFLESQASKKAYSLYQSGRN
jgi:hypothetical protein